MKDRSKTMLQNFIKNYPELSEVKSSAEAALSLLIEELKNGNRLFVCGNGGSASDCGHITGELLKSFRLPRTLSSHDIKKILSLPDGEYLSEKLQYGIPCYDLTANLATQTAISNDIGAPLVFAQQLFVYGRPGDVLLAISTSGNSKNVYLAAQVARIKNMKVIALQGSNKTSNLAKLSDVLISVPRDETYLIQELHLPIYHFICLALEYEFFGEE